MSKTTAPAEPGRHADVGFHAGELAVQRRAGTREEAERLSPMLDPAELRGGIVAFLADRTFAVITARDADGRLWSSPLTGPAGFLEAVTPTTLSIHARLPEGDPLHGLPAGQQAGLVVVEFATRRRVRVNGTLTAAGDGALAIDVEQAYGNCPQYIHQRVLAPGDPGRRDPGDVRRDAGLSPADAELIRRRGHVLPRHHEPGTRLGHLAPGRRARVRPGRRRPALVAGLPGQQPLQLLRQPRRRSRGVPALLRLRHRAHAPAVRHRRGRLGRRRPAGRRRADRPASRLHRCSGWWRGACCRPGRSRTAPTRAIPPSPTD